MAPLRLTDGIHHARDQQVRDDGREQAPRPEHDQVGIADGIERRPVCLDLALTAQLHVCKRRTRMTGNRLALDIAPIARARYQRHAIER